MKKISNNTKKSFIATSLVGLIISFSNNANANVSEMVDGARFYVGAGVGYNHYGIHGDFKKVIENSTNRASVKVNSADFLIPLLGVKFKDYFGLEFGYAFHNKLKVSGTNSGSLKIRNAFVDIMGYMPLDSSPVDLLGGIGIGRMAMSGKGSAVQSAVGGDYNKFGVRAKFGAQYNVDNNWGVRGLIGYQQIGHKDSHHALKNSQFANVDVVYLI
ncbi:MAG: outer membrane beta-barrel protein [Gammaproteobacteria bacterium]|jgi:opacity protein-like surface antigen